MNWSYLTEIQIVWAMIEKEENRKNWLKMTLDRTHLNSKKLARIAESSNRVLRNMNSDYWICIHEMYGGVVDLVSFCAWIESWEKIVGKEFD